MYFTFQEKHIFYQVYGKGDPVILIHAFGLDHSAYLEFLDSFKGKHRFHLVDLPGIGKSEPLDSYSMETLADMIAHMIETLGLKGAIVIGHSIGGYIGLELLRRYEPLLSKFVLLHSFSDADSAEKKADRLKNIAFIKKYGPVLYFKELLSKLFLEEFIEQNRFFMDTLAFQSSSYTAAGVIGLIQAMIDRKDQREVLKNASIPIGFILGDRDVIIPQKQSQDQVVLPSIASIDVIKDAGHMGPFEKPVAVRKALESFFEL